MKQKENAVITAEEREKRINNAIVKHVRSLSEDWLGGFDEAPENIAKAYIEISTALSNLRDFDLGDEMFIIKTIFDTFTEIKEEINNVD